MPGYAHKKACIFREKLGEFGKKKGIFLFLLIKFADYTFNAGKLFKTRKTRGSYSCLFQTNFAGFFLV